MIDYKFRTVENAAFYIYNAHIHDWIHDFNNYTRMGKIQNYIQEVFTYVTGTRGGKKTNYNRLVGGNDDDITSADLSDDDFAAVFDKLCDDDDNYENNGIIQNIMTGVDDAKERDYIMTIISNYNNIKSRTRYRTRSKVHLLQQIESSIKEFILVIIGRINNISNTNALYSGGKKNKKGGGPIRAIDMISKNDISNIIDNIIKEISDEFIKTKNKNLTALLQIFLFTKNVFLQLNIPNISPLEILDNSLITDSICCFILSNPFVMKKNIYLYSNIILKLFISKNQTLNNRKRNNRESIQVAPKQMKTGRIIPRNIFSPFNKLVLAGGATFNGKVYRDNKDSIPFQNLDKFITDYNETTIFNMSDESRLKNLYEKGEFEDTRGELHDIFIRFTETHKDSIELILGKSLKNSSINNVTTFYNRYQTTRGRRLELAKTTYYKSVTDFIFVKVIDTYSDIKNKVDATLSSSSSPKSLSPQTRNDVQRISKLVAKKSLELINYKETGDVDLNMQIEIIKNVADGSRFTSVDNDLMKHFQTSTPNSDPNIKKNYNDIVNKRGQGIRVINNAVDSDLNEGVLKTKASVICPTSSVCDGMKSYGNCFGSELTNEKKEYYNMNFELSDKDNLISYYGNTILSNSNKKVIITYGCYANKLNLDNIITLDISKAPIELQANTSFKGVINQIITIWKSSVVSDIEQLWQLLEFDDFFLSILKVGSKKAIGDIFQELNVVLENGGYSSPPSTIRSKTTIGLMGDRPSGIRIVKLLKNATKGTNPNVIGGYVASSNTLIYASDVALRGGGFKKYKSLKTSKKHRKTSKRYRKINRKNRKTNKKHRKTRKRFSR